MHQTQFRRNSRAALLAAIAAAYPIASYSAPAARVDFAVGDVTAVNAGGQSRALAKGAQLDQGETINTNNGRAQLRFTDGAFVSLQPESQFRIDQYRFEGKVDGSEKGLFSLLKGGLRTITGLVGRNNRKNYQISTTVATIGIRGTEYTIQYGQSISGTVGEGEIEVCNGAGCLNVTDGESYYVQSQEFKPVLSNKKTDLPPPPPTNPPPTFAQGENVTSSGTPTAFILTGTQALNVTFTHDFLVIGSGTDHSGTISPYRSTVTLDADGLLESFLEPSGSPTTRGTTSVVDSGNDGLIAWGRLVDGTLGGTATGVGDHAGSTLPPGSNTSLHYIVGLPAVVPTTGTASYKMMGGTAPTFTSGSTIALGTLVSATMTANFSSGFANGSLNISLKDPAGSPVGITSSFISASGTLFTSGATVSWANCGSTCTGTVYGFFAGANAERVGISYDFAATAAPSPTEGRGVVALTR
jgi:FecR-like protein